MLFRLSPFVRSWYNFCFNIKTCRARVVAPAFKSLNHPFSTNRQLLDASYIHWVVNNSKKLPHKLFSSVDECNDKQDDEDYKGNNNKLYSFSTAIKFPDGAKNDRINGAENVNEDPSSRRVNIIHVPNLKKHCDTLIQYSEQEKASIDVMEVLNIFKEAMKDIPGREALPTMPEIEAPLFQAEKKINHEAYFYKFLHDRIPHIFRLYKSYEKFLGNNRIFQEDFIWLSYHQGDNHTLQRLLLNYLNNSGYSSKSLSYLLSGFILNYEVEFTKNLIYSIIGLGVRLEASLLENIIFQLVKVNSIFENICTIVDVWIASVNCETPNAKTMSLVLDEYYRYGTPKEIDSIKSTIASIDLFDHYMVKECKLRNKIVRRNPYSIKKEILPEDIEEFTDISLSVVDRKEKEQLYYIHLNFLTRYSNMEMIQVVLHQMRDFGIVITDKFYRLISRFYAKHEKFVQLFKFLKAIASKNSFNEIYLRDLFEAYISSYPYLAKEFESLFRTWLKRNKNFSAFDRDRFLSSMKVKKVDSQYTPYGLAQSHLNSEKYSSSDWSDIIWKKDTHGKVRSAAEQVDFRVSKGFRDVLRKGVKPDYKLIEQTFRRSDYINRRKLFELVETLRLPESKLEQMKILGLQLQNNKDSIMDYINNGTHHLNCNNRIFLGRMLYNKGLYHEAKEIIKNIAPLEMNDRTLMTKLNFELRIDFALKHYEEMKNSIENFPINDIVLSPYIHTQCVYIERKVSHRLKSEKQRQKDTESQYHLPSDSWYAVCGNLEVVSKALRGLVGDIQLRLVNDKKDLALEVRAMFDFLDTWTNFTKDDRSI